MSLHFDVDKAKRMLFKESFPILFEKFDFFNFSASHPLLISRFAKLLYLDLMCFEVVIIFMILVN